jgi:hypothetical protein
VPAGGALFPFPPPLRPYSPGGAAPAPHTPESGASGLPPPTTPTTAANAPRSRPRPPGGAPQSAGAVGCAGCGLWVVG